MANQELTFNGFLQKFWIFYALATARLVFKLRTQSYPLEVVIGGLVLAVGLNYLIFLIWKQWRTSKGAAGFSKQVYEKETTILLSQPAIYPTDLVESLKAVFAYIPSVKAAYMAQMAGPNEGASKVIGLQIEGEDMGAVISRMQRQQVVLPENANFLDISQSGDMAQYFLRQTKPFYFNRDS